MSVLTKLKKTGPVKCRVFTMKYIAIIILCLFGTAYGQTTGYFRYDTIRMQKSGGNSELYIENATRSVTGGVLTNVGNGRTAFVSGGSLGDWHILGNTGTTAGTNFIGTTDNQALWFNTNNVNRLIIPAGGIASSTASTDSVLVTKTDGVTLGKIAKTSLYPTWQETLTTGSTLSTSNTANLGSNNFTFDGTSNDIIIRGNSDLALEVTGSTNSSNRMRVSNLSSGAGAAATFQAVNDLSDQMVVQSTSSGFTTGGARPRVGLLHSNADGGLQIAAARINTGLYFGVGLGSTTLAAAANVATVSGTTGNWIFETGTFTPTDNGRKVQVTGKASISDTLFNIGNKYNGTSAALTMAVYDTITGGYFHQPLPSSGGITGFTTFGSTPNANGGSVSGANIILQPADGSNPGGVSTTTQTLAGAKTFSGLLTGSALLRTNNGTVSAPSHSFTNSTGTGLYYDGTYYGESTFGVPVRNTFAVSGTTGFVQMDFTSPSTATLGDGKSYTSFVGGDTYSTSGIFQAGAASLIANSGLANGFNIGATHASAPIKFWTNGSERMRITPAGLVGINTTTPDSTLTNNGSIHNLGNSLFDGNVGIGAAAPSGTLFSVYDPVKGYISVIDPLHGLYGFGTSGNSEILIDGANLVASINLNGDNVLTLDHTTQISTYTANNGHQFTGNVGIGTAPDSTLDVNGSGRISTNLLVGGNVGIGVSAVANPFEVYLGAQPAIRVTTAGNLLFSPKTSTTSISFQDYTGAGLFNAGLVSGKPYVGFGDIEANYNNTNILIDDDNSNIMFTASSGVGIGTVPTEALDVNGNILASGTITPSDRRYKTNIKSFDNGLSLINKLNPATYEYKQGLQRKFNKGKQFGLIAQEVEKIIPEVVVTNKDGYKAINYTELIPILIKAVQELNDKVSSQQQEIDNLKRNK